MRTHIPLVLVSCLLTMLIIWPIKGVGDWYPMHDSTHPSRVMLMLDTLRKGQIPPIWAEDINKGYGYPLFHFYAPLFHTVATSIAMVTSVETALKITLVLSLIVGSAGVFVWARRWGSWTALVASCLFAMSPYIAIDIYVRGAYAELLSICLIPWVFVATEKIKTKQDVLTSAGALSLFVLSHNLIPLIIIPMVAVWMAVHNTKTYKQAVWAVLLAGALSAWYLVPVLFERSFSVADTIARTTNYALHFVEPWQIWNSTWGFGGSAAGVEDGMSFKMGKIHIVLAALGVALSVMKKNKSLITVSFFLIATLFLATPLSKMFWEASQTLQIVQFPWRTLGPASVFGAVLGAYAVSRVRHRYVRVVCALGVILGAFVMGYKYFRPQSIEAFPAEVRDIASVVPEYMPRWFVPTDERPELLDQNKGVTTLERAYYPTWIVEVEGKQIKPFPSETGLLSFDNPQGSTDFRLLQSHTDLEKAARAVSLGALLLVIIMSFWRKNHARA